MTEKRIVYPEPENLKFVLRYFTTKVDKYIRDAGDKHLLKIYAKEIAKLLVGNKDDYEIAIKDHINSSETISCSRCKTIIKKPELLSMEPDNKTFCPKCGLIRLIYKRSDISDYINKNTDLIKNNHYIMIDQLIIYEDLYNRAVLSVQWKLRKRLEKYIKEDVFAIEKSENMEENNII